MQLLYMKQTYLQIQFVRLFIYCFIFLVFDVPKSCGPVYACEFPETFEIRIIIYE